MSGIVAFRVEAQANGRSQVLVNGQDVSGNVRGFTIAAEEGQCPILTLYENSEGVIEGEGIVRVQDAGLDQRESVLKFLGNLDDQELNRQAMSAMAVDPSMSPGDGFLQALREMCRGD